MSENSSESLVRWQEAVRAQLGTVLNLVLGLGTGLIAFESKFLLDARFAAPWAFWFALSGVLLLCASVGCALWCAVNRLSDYKLTVQIIQERSEGSAVVSAKRAKARTLGQKTWRLFTVQLWLFGLGAAASALGVLVEIAL